MTDSNPASNVSALSQYMGLSTRQRTELRRQLQEITRDMLAKLVRNMLDKADDALFDLSSKSDTNVAQQAYFDAMRDIRVRRSRIESGLLEFSQKAFERFEKEKSLPEFARESKPQAGESLELMDEEAMEENMAIQNMAEKQERQLQHELYELTARMKVLYQCQELDTHQHPLSPITLAGAFGETLRPMDIDFHVKLIIYKLYDKFVMGSIGFAYKEINALLKRENVLPDLRYTYKRNTSYYPKHPVRHAPGYHGHGQENSGAFDWETVPGIMPTNFGLQGFAPEMQQGIGLVGTLSAMQNFISQQGYPVDMRPVEMGAQIITGSRRLGFASVLENRVVDEKVINMVSMIFDFILEDEGIPKPIKGLLARLQIPYLKLALLDDSFLSRNDHAARLLLNDMAKASIGWNYSRIKCDLYSKIDAIISTILNQFEQDVSMFTRLQTEFREYWQNEQKANQAYEERAWKTAEGKERVQYAKTRVDAWIHMWCSRQETRRLVSAFLRHVWKNAMLYFMHKFGEDSREWRHYIKIINGLIWSTTPNKSEEETRKLIKVIPLLVRSLNRGMLAVATHPNTISTFFKGLSECHLGIIQSGLGVSGSEGMDPDNPQESLLIRGEDGQPLENLAAAYEQPTEVEPEQAEIVVDEELETEVEHVVLEAREPQPEAIEPAERDDYYKQALALEYGDWLEFKLEDGQKIAAKLAWKSTITTNRLFVGRDGIRFAEKKLSEIAAHLRAGEARVLDGKPVFDRALDQAQVNLAGTTAPGEGDDPNPQDPPDAVP